MKYLLDTDICIFYLKGKYELHDMIRSVGFRNCYVSEITVAELKYGSVKSQNVEKHGQDVLKIVKLFDVLPMFSALDMYAQERVRLEKAGERIPDFDLLIAATALENKLVLVTNNTRHFSRIAGLEIQNWTLVTDNKFLK